MTAWRQIVTDSESLTGVAPVCTTDHTPLSPDGDAPLLNWVFDCCPHPHIETWSEATAETLAKVLTAAEAEVCS